MNMKVKTNNKENLYTEVKIPAFTLLRKSMNLIKLPVEGRANPALLNPLMISNSILMRNGRYMADKSVMLYKHMLEDPTLDVQFTGKIPNTNNYDCIRYENKTLSLILSTGLTVTVKVSTKVVRYANKILEAKLDAEHNMYLISAMYIYTNLIESYTYPIMIVTRNTMPITARDGRMMSVKKSDANTRSELTPEQEVKYSRIQEAGASIIKLSRALSIQYETTVTIMSMLHYLLGYYKDNYHSMYTNKYIDFIIREMVNKPIDTIPLKRHMIKYLIMYRAFIYTNKTI